MQYRKYWNVKKKQPTKHFFFDCAVLRWCSGVALSERVTQASNACAASTLRHLRASCAVAVLRWRGGVTLSERVSQASNACADSTLRCFCAVAVLHWCSGVASLER